MAAFTDYLRNKVIDWFFRGVSYTPPAGLYWAAFTSATNAAGAGTEASGGSYARVNLAPSASNYASTGGATTTTSPSVGTTGQTSNNAIITFPTPSGSWGTITHVALMDASSGGNMLLQGALTTPRTVTDSGTPLSIPISAVTFTLS